MLNTPYTKLWVEEGILFFVYKSCPVVTLKMAEKIVQDRINFQKDRSYPILCDLRRLHTVEKSARDYLAVQGTYMARALALIVDKHYSARLSAQYLKTSKPPVPTFEFTSILEAKEFLKPYRKKM